MRENHPTPIRPLLRLLLAAAFLVPVSLYCAEAAAEPLPVAVSLAPLAWPISQIAGTLAEVTVLLPPGASPHAWEPTPRQRIALAQARLVLRVGHPSLPFEARLLEASGTSEPRAMILDLCRSVDCSVSQESPHPWLDPAAMRLFARDVAAALEPLLPSQRAQLEARLTAVERRIDALDRKVRSLLAGLEGSKFFVDHPAWEAFANAYGLEQVAIETGGKEPGPRRLVALVEEARSRQTRVIFAERGSSGRAARALAAELGADVVILDPLAADWATNLEHTARHLAEALR